MRINGLTVHGLLLQRAEFQRILDMCLVGRILYGNFGTSIQLLTLIPYPNTCTGFLEAFHAHIESFGGYSATLGPHQRGSKLIPLDSKLPGYRCLRHSK